MKKILCLFFFVVASFASYCQSDDLSDKAAQLYAKKEYPASAQFYEIAAATSKYRDDKPLFFYNAACSWALAGNKTRALEVLQKAIDMGWRDMEAVQKDQDLSPLREEPGWTKLLEQYKLKLVTEKNIYYWGFFLGLLFFLFFYNFILFVSLRDVSFLYYSLSILLFAHFEMGRTPEFGDYASEMLTWYKKFNIERAGLLFISLNVAFFLLFTRSFLKLKENLPRGDKWMKIFIGLFVLSALLAISPMQGPLKFISFALILTAFIFSFVIGILCWKRGFKPARFFLVAFISLLIGVHIVILNDFHLIDLRFKILVFGPDNIGLILFYLLLSFALGDRINILKKEKEEAQEKALEVLEEKVKERTAEVVKQKELIEEKQKEILDSIRYAKRIQRSLLPTEKYLERILKK